MDTLDVERRDIYIEYDEDYLDEEDKNNLITRCQITLTTCCRRNLVKLKRSIILILLIGYTVYLGFAIAHSLSGAVALIIITCIVVLGLGYTCLKRFLGKWLWNTCLQPCNKQIDRQWHWLKW